MMYRVLKHELPRWCKELFKLDKESTLVTVILFEFMWMISTQVIESGSPNGDSYAIHTVANSLFKETQEFFFAQFFKCWQF